MDCANAILQQTFAVKNSHMIIPDVPGAGIAWDEDAVKKYLLA